MIILPSWLIELANLKSDKEITDISEIECLFTIYIVSFECADLAFN